VSEATIRRTLSELEIDGKVIRTHGGVQLYTNRSHEYIFENRFTRNLEQKKAIAKSAVKLLGSNEVIFLDSGTTVFFTAESIARMIEADQIKGLRVVTNSIAVAEALGDLCEVTILGGKIRVSRKDLYGPLVEKSIKLFRAHKAFIGADGITIKDGLMTTDEFTSKIDEEMIDRSDEVILLADSTKFNSPSFVSYATLDAINIIITDKSLDNTLRKDFEDLGIRIIMADLKE
jgi:DeoR family fructose operon transcriptional repressor